MKQNKNLNFFYMQKKKNINTKINEMNFLLTTEIEVNENTQIYKYVCFLLVYLRKLNEQKMRKKMNEKNGQTFKSSFIN